MLAVKWEYFEKNINTNKAVAVLKDATYKNILYVYEDENSHYCSICKDFIFIRPTTVSYLIEEERVNSTYSKEELDSLSAHERAVLRLKEGCKIIEENFHNQTKMIEKFSNN